MRAKWCFVAVIALLLGSAVAPAADVPDGAALINVRVPEFADVWVAGEKTHLQGTSRDFVTPQLDPGRRFIYDVRARWIEKGVVIDVTRKVPVRSDDRVRVDFDASMPRTATREVIVERTPIRQAFYVDITEDARIPERAAIIKVHVPTNAEVWLSGEKQHQGGNNRKFMTKALETDKQYTAQIRAKWKEDGLEVDQTRKVELHPGDSITVDFLQQSRKPANEPNPDRDN